MLQQTQMERGVAYFQRWMGRFPDVRSVAEAPEEEILRYWEGLGYYRRARFLHQAAKIMLERHGGAVPDSQEELSSLPGLGDYTVAAILGIAYEQDMVSIDANVERVFSRLMNIDSPVKKNPAAALIRQEAQRLLPHGQARAYNQALMELGALVCGKSPAMPAVSACLLVFGAQVGCGKGTSCCRGQKTRTIPVTSAHGILIVEGKVLLLRRSPEGLRGQHVGIPRNGGLSGSPQEAVIRTLAEMGVPVEIIAPLGQVQHGYTNHRLTRPLFSHWPPIPR